VDAEGQRNYASVLNYTCSDSDYVVSGALLLTMAF